MSLSPLSLHLIPRCPRNVGMTRKMWWVRQSLSILNTSPYHLSLINLIWFGRDSSLNKVLRWWYHLILHKPFKWMGLYILRRIFLSNLSSLSQALWIRTHVSAIYFTIGRIRALHIRNFVALDRIFPLSYDRLKRFFFIFHYSCVVYSVKSFRFRGDASLP